MNYSITKKDRNRQATYHTLDKTICKHLFPTASPIPTCPLSELGILGQSARTYDWQHMYVRNDSIYHWQIEESSFSKSDWFSIPLRNRCTPIISAPPNPPWYTWIRSQTAAPCAHPYHRCDPIAMSSSRLSRCVERLRGRGKGLLCDSFIELLTYHTR